MTRILPREDYARLVAADPSVDWLALPRHAQVLVIERGEAIVAHWLYLPVAHAEAVWKRADCGAGVNRLLLDGMRQIIHDDGAESVWMSAIDNRMRELLAHLGAVRVPGTHYLVRL